MSGDEEPPPEVHHYEDRGQVPWDIQKYGFSDGFFFLSQSSQLTLFYSYWSQRYDLFSKYDDGVWLTDDAWFGVTPEPVATYVNLCEILTVKRTKPLTSVIYAQKDRRSNSQFCTPGSKGPSRCFRWCWGKYHRVRAVRALETSLCH